MTAQWQRAVRRGDASELRTLLDAGADVDARDKYGQTALMIAAQRGHADVVRALLAAGAALDHTAKYELTAVMRAVINGHVEIVRLLVEAGADLAIRGSGAPGFAGRTAFDLADAQGRADLTAILRRAS